MGYGRGKEHRNMLRAHKVLFFYQRESRDFSKVRFRCLFILCECTDTFLTNEIGKTVTLRSVTVFPNGRGMLNPTIGAWRPIPLAETHDARSVLATSAITTPNGGNGDAPQCLGRN